MITCGTDIIKISRVKDSIERVGETFLKRVYTDEEIEYCESRRMCKYQSYAARFAAKEAIYKAISPDISSGSEWKDAEVCKLDNGKPYLKLHGCLEKIALEKNIKNIELSLSHDDDYAIACVVIDKEND